MTKKTRIYLWFYRFFDRIGRIGQWFITHCDMEDEGLNEKYSKIVCEYCDDYEYRKKCLKGKDGVCGG